MDANNICAPFKIVKIPKKIELIWCMDAIKICAPYNTVKIPKTICKIIQKPKKLIDLYKL